MQICPKCGYERTPQDKVPETDCPKCGVIYSKYKPPSIDTVGIDKSPSSEASHDLFKTDVFTREDSSEDSISAGTYNLTLGLVLCWGFFINYLMLKNIPAETILHINPTIFFFGYFASCLFGIYLFTNSDNPLISFIGFNCVVVPFGMIINIVVSRYNSSLVVDAVVITGIVTGVMMLLGSAFPWFFEKISGALFVALISVVIIEGIEIYILGIHHNAIDWAVIVIFCGYVGYDWGRANSIPKTIDNAVDSASALYMDIVNLFLRILRILGRK